MSSSQTKFFAALAVILWHTLNRCVDKMGWKGLASTDARRCSGCGSQIKSGANFCTQCGEPQPSAACKPARICRQCGAAVKATARFCRQCGVKLNVEEKRGYRDALL